MENIIKRSIKVRLVIQVPVLLAIMQVHIMEYIHIQDLRVSVF